MADSSGVQDPGGARASQFDAWVSATFGVDLAAYGGSSLQASSPPSNLFGAPGGQAKPQPPSKPPAQGPTGQKPQPAPTTAQVRVVQDELSSTFHILARTSKP